MPINHRILAVKTMRKRKDGTTGWQQPVMTPQWYTLFCCDCALGHKIQFRVVHTFDRTIDTRKGKPVVQFRVRRADRYTQMKRKMKSEKGHISILKKGECVRALVDNVMVITLVNGLRRGGAKRERKKRGRK